MISEITEEEEKDEEPPSFVNTEAEKKKIRQIIEYQKSLYWSCSSSLSSSSSASCSSLSSSHRSSSLLELMRVGNTSLRRLFDMEHTTLATHFKDYSGSPMVKTIPLWGSETDDERKDDDHDPWASIRQVRLFSDLGSDRRSQVASDGSFKDGALGFKDKKVRPGKRKLTRKRSFRKLPGFQFWRCRGFRFRLRRLRIRISGRIF